MFLSQDTPTTAIPSMHDSDLDMATAHLFTNI